MKKITIFILSCIVFTLFAYEYNDAVITINKTKIYVDIAESELERAYGLMYRDSLPDSCGMLFVFEYEQELSFWMRNTKIPLSIAYINKSGMIVDIQDMEPLSDKSVASALPAIYALEVNQGFFKKNGIKVGDRIDF